LTEIELALEILHTRSNTAQDSPMKSIQHLEKETIEKGIKSKSTQLKKKKNSSTGLTDALASVHPKLSGRTDAPVGLYHLYANWNQVKLSWSPDELMG